MIQYSKEQLSILDAIEKGKSLLLRGAAGCGKTAIIKNLQALLEERDIYKHIHKTASSGIAAIELSAQREPRAKTVSSLLRLGIYDFTDEEVVTRNSFRYDINIRPGDIFIIDEAFALNANQMHQIDLALQTITGINWPFGGCQMVLVGDHCQFKPENGPSWVNTNLVQDFEIIDLHHSFRHENDPTFLDRLNILRNAIQEESHIDLVMWWADMLPDLNPTKSVDDLILSAYYTNAQKVNAHHQKQLAKEKKEIIVTPNYYGEDCPDAPYLEQRFSVGTPVVHVLNRNGLVNGSRGIVTAIDFDTETVTINCNGEKYDICREVLWNRHSGSETHFHPIMQAFSLTARKVQGMTLSEGIISHDLRMPSVDLRRLYTALSRFTHRNGISYLSA